jgi:hypothetical protein
MTPRTWLLVTQEASPEFRDHDWFAERSPVPDELASRDRIAIVSWRARGQPMLAATASVWRLSRETRTLRLRHRVSSVPGHEIAVAALGSRLAFARGWTAERRTELIAEMCLIGEHDFALIEETLLAAAHAFGPPPKRPAHRRPRAPGRRAMLAGRASARGALGPGRR